MDQVCASASFSEKAAVSLPPQGLLLSDVEKELIVQALKMVEGNQTRAARLLGLTRNALRYRMQKSGLL